MSISALNQGPVNAHLLVTDGGMLIYSVTGLIQWW